MAETRRPREGAVANRTALTSERLAQRRSAEARRKSTSKRGEGHRRPEPTIQGRGLRVRLSRTQQTSRKLLGSPFFFQVPPLETFTVQHGYNFSDYETIDAGQFSRSMGRNLKIVEFQTMFVDQDWFFTLVHQENTGPNPQKMAHELVEILNKGTPFHLLVGQAALWGEGNYDIDMDATLRTLTVEERAGEVDARYVNVSFSEWRPLRIKKAGKGERLPRDYTIRAGDTLRKLAKEFYGETRLWRLIARANGLGDIRPDESLENIRKAGKRVKTLYLPRPPAREGEAGLDWQRSAD